MRHSCGSVLSWYSAWQKNCARADSLSSAPFFQQLVSGQRSRVCDFERAGPYCMMAEALAEAKADLGQFAYLTGGNYGRGFSTYVRDFNANFLALPALPSRKLDGAASAAGVVVRQIDSPTHGTWLAVVNTSMTEAKGVKVKLPAAGTVKLAVGGRELPATGGQISLDLRPYQLVTLTVGAK